MMYLAAATVPAAGVERDRQRGPGRLNGSGLAHAALHVADTHQGAFELGTPDLVLVAVQAGQGDTLRQQLLGKDPGR